MGSYHSTKKVIVKTQIQEDQPPIEKHQNNQVHQPEINYTYIDKGKYYGDLKDGRRHGTGT